MGAALTTITELLYTLSQPCQYGLGVGWENRGSFLLEIHAAQSLLPYAGTSGAFKGL